MISFLTIVLLSGVIAFVVSFVCLLIFSYAGTGFGFGDLKQDLVKLVFIGLVVGAVDAAWQLLPWQHWSFYALTAVVHIGALRAAFMPDLSAAEATAPAVVTRLVYIGVLLKIAPVWQAVI
jgi:hypothetical protein